MHTKQWLSKQGTWPNKGLLGCGGHGCLGLLWRHKYEVVGSNNRSILYLGKQAESYKVMIYAPPCLEIDGCRRCSRSQSRNISESNRESTEEGNTGSKQRTCILLLRSNISKQANIAGLDMMHVSLIAWNECNYKQV